MLTIRDEDDLLSALYQGPFEQPLWNTFLERLRARTGARYAGIIFRPPDRPANSPIELFSGERAPAHLNRLYEEELYKTDPFLAFDLREGRVYSLSELLLDSNPEHVRFRREVLEPSGIRHMRIVRVSEPGGVSAWLSISRDRPDFTAADAAMLSRLAIHFRTCLRSHIALEREKLRASIADDVMSRLSFGWISLDVNGCVVERTPEATRILQYEQGLRISRSGRLVATDPATERKLSAAIKAFAASPGERPRAFNIGTDPWVEMLLAPLSGSNEGTAGTPAMIAYLQGDTRSASDRNEQIAELFGLLPSEARLALALSRGMTIAEAAESLGITVETARNYSKKIYAKMGARGQNDLIRYILTSVLALA
ncbi:MAG: helix-turn-helix transcriptional regulator [Novosphingobium sp.]|nr:helix-turn-helix transcriptional regulator [Novosphingobium sp.]